LQNSELSFSVKIAELSRQIGVLKSRIVQKSELGRKVKN